jgi:L-threonylcarbamoyladenylate synthase
MSIGNEILKCLEVLEKGGTILYPTDTVWGLGCDATNEKAVARIYKIKQRLDSKSLIILLHDPAFLEKYVENVPDIAWDLMKSVGKPLTIIYPHAINLPGNVTGEDHSIAIRIVKNEFCRELIRKFGKPIVSTSANISGEPAPLVFKFISPELIGKVDYCVDYQRDEIQEVKPSRIIKLNENGEFYIIRP